MRKLATMRIHDREKVRYTRRTDTTIAQFPELNAEALGFVYRALLRGIPRAERAHWDYEKSTRLERLIARQDFAKLYAFAQLGTVGNLNRESIDGTWIKYDQGSDYQVLEEALRGKGSGWCTAEGSAAQHLKEVDFYVYLTKGTMGTYSEPRIAIRLEGDQVVEVRGVNPHQELEPELIDIAQKQYHALPGGEMFDKKSADMRRVTTLAAKHAQGETLSREDLIFLYELKEKIEGFGYGTDPRIEEIKSTRDTLADYSTVYDCSRDQVVTDPAKITEETQVYIRANA